jgi:molybdenum cofactor cytidylyltransferase
MESGRERPSDKSGPAKVGAVILAAGSSSRMGAPKQLLLYRGETLLRRAAAAALEAGCRPVIVVTGAHAGRTREELHSLDVLEVENPLWGDGMGSSVRAGVEALAKVDAGAEAVVLMLCDQPFVDAEVVAGLVAAHRATGRPVVASRYGESFGAPALFGRELFAELAGLGGGRGAQQVIKEHASEAHFVPFPLGEVDVDTPDDFARLLELPPSAAGDVPPDRAASGE